MAVTAIEDLPAHATPTPPPSSPAAQEAAPADPSAAALSTAPTAPDEPSAKLTARLKRVRVEIEQARTETTSTYANPDGSLTVETFSGPIRYRENGAWVPVDTTLTALTDGSVSARSHQKDLRIGGRSRAAATDLITLGPVTLQWLGALPAPQVQDDTVTYPEALPKADLVVTATRTGAEQFLLLKERPAAPVSYRLRLSAPGYKARQSAGGIELVDKKGKVAVTVPAPVMWDAKVDQGSGEHLNRGAVTMRLRGQDLIVTPDPAFLADPATAYPVTVDPSVNIGQIFDTFVQQGYGTDQSGATELKLGNNGSGQIARSFITWKTPGIAGKKILGATLNLWNFHSWSCSARNWEVWTANQATTASRWPGPALAAKYATSGQTKGFGTGCADGWVSANVTGLLQHWADKGWSESGMGLRATDEGDSYGWKRFNSGNATSHVPYISVTYNSYPTAPQSTWPSPLSEHGSAVWSNSATPQLRAHVGDADGGNVRGLFDVYDGSTLVLDDVAGGYVGSGGFSATGNLPAGKLVNGRTYQIRAWSNDGSLSSKTYTTRTFTVDTAAPAAPSVSSSSHPDAGWQGDAGKPATFTVTPASGDAGWISYRLDDGVTAKVESGGEAKTFSVTPAQPGPHTLTVTTIDKAGNASPEVARTFNVGAGTVSAPEDAHRTARRTELGATGRGEYDRVTFQWRRAETDAWADIPLAHVLGADGRQLPAWPVQASVNGGTATVSGLTWNLVDQLGGDGAVQVRAVFGNASGATSATSATDVVADRAASGAATEELGSGTLNLLTGDFRLNGSEAELFGLSLSRTASSRDTKLGAKIAGQVSPFGPEWSAGGVSEVAASEYATLRETSASSIELTMVDGTPIQFTKTSSGWKAEEGAEELTLTGTYTLKDADGVVTTFVKSGTTFLPATTSPPGENNVTRYVYETNRLKAIIAPTGAVADPAADCALPAPKAGCRVLELVYSGDRVGQVRFHDSGTPVAVAQYSYDANGRLSAAWDPRVSPPLKTVYGYDAAGRITSLTPPGELPWTYAYDAEGRLLSASRPGLKPGTADQVEGEAKTSIVYDVPLDRAGGGPADLKPQHTRAWGQSDNPTDATAVFPADQLPGSGWARATVTYLDASGREVNTLTPGGHVTTTEHDKFGNAVRELTADNRELALGTSARLAELGVSGLGTAERAELLSTRSLYSEDGQRETEEFGPLHVADEGVVRKHTVNAYDEGRPADAPTKNLVTKVSVGARPLNAGADTGVRTTTTEYDWKLGLATKTVKDPGGLNLVTTTAYDAEGRATRSTLPKGNDAATVVTAYYTATGAAPCGGKPAWSGLVCRVAPAGKVVGGGANPDEMPAKLTTYTRFGNPATVAETANGVTKTTHTAYDAADRPLTSWFTGGLGKPLQTSNLYYAPDSGDVQEKQRLDAAGAVTERVVEVHDKLGRTISYTDADGGVTRTEYDLLGRTVKVSDSAPSSRVYAYDHAAEPRGLAVSVTDSAAGTFTAAYDADGQFAAGGLPGGLRVTAIDDETGADVSRVYTKDGVAEPIMSEQVVESVHGAWITHTRSDAGYERVYGYDQAGRLTSAKETLGERCELRAYGFDANTNRTRKSVRECAADESSATVTTWGYDSGDRLTGPSYDQLGRTTSLPGGAAFEYHVNDLVAKQSLGGKEMTWTLDPADRFRAATGEAGTSVNHYDAEGDTPSWISGPNGQLSRNVNGVDGDLAAVTAGPGQVRLQLTTLHGDVAAELALDTGAATVLDADEFGVSRSQARRYNWLGGKQRSAETLDGVILMGVRLYSPELGRFLQIDPVAGGSANAYEYCLGDPVNCTDLDGQWAFLVRIGIQACIRWCARGGRAAWGAARKWGPRAWSWGKRWGRRGYRAGYRVSHYGRVAASRGSYFGAMAGAGYGGYCGWRTRSWRCAYGAAAWGGGAVLGAVGGTGYGVYRGWKYGRKIWKRWRGIFR
ncbi:DNRLRE domain-containing protein [Nonomuraea typhae]|uniref:DNRLRE domain-containing protein n=1 Tax=Nonomuraea typhae TaxID=2603600 RepID=UPI0012FB4B8D|nr:DNRLRE domain-containing protein [Nonomuraea typhae]